MRVAAHSIPYIAQCVCACTRSYTLHRLNISAFHFPSNSLYVWLSKRNDKLLPKFMGFAARIRMEYEFLLGEVNYAIAHHRTTHTYKVFRQNNPSRFILFDIWFDCSKAYKRSYSATATPSPLSLPLCSIERNERKVHVMLNIWPCLVSVKLFFLLISVAVTMIAINSFKESNQIQFHSKFDSNRMNSIDRGLVLYG